MRNVCVLLVVISFTQSFDNHSLIYGEKLKEAECGCINPSGRRPAVVDIACLRALGWMASNMRPQRAELLAACLIAANGIGNQSADAADWRNLAIDFLLESSGYHALGNAEAVNALRLMPNSCTFPRK
jgi:hypothetical protein